MGDFVQLEWRNDWGVNFLASDAWHNAGVSSISRQGAKLQPQVSFLWADGTPDSGVVSYQHKRARVYDHGKPYDCSHSVPLISVDVNGTSTRIDPTSVRIARSSFERLPEPEDAS